MDSGSSFRFGQGFETGPVHLGGGGAAATAAHQLMPGTGMPIPTGMSSLLLGTGGGYLSPAGYGTLPANFVHAAWNGGAAVAGGQQQQPRASGTVMRRPPTLRGPWTEEEDETLKEMVKVYGERKWAAVSQHLPGRIGKQCRERWTNHLRPGVDKAKTIWTEEDDMLLIRAHKIHGNRWSLIARDLTGRSENAVKNHWNATKRSLKAKRRLKKKTNAEAPPGQQWSILEQYIRSLPPAATADDGAGGGAAPQKEPSDDSPPSSYNTGGASAYYGGEVVSPAPLAPAGACGFDPTALGMYLSAVAAAAGNNNNNSSAAAAEEVNLGAMNPDLAPPSYLGLDLNSYYYYGGAAQEAEAAPPQMMMMEQADQQQQTSSYASNNNLVTYPFVDQMAWQPSSSVVHATDAYYANDNANASHYPYYYYYGDAAGAGPSGAAAAAAVADDVDVVQMASMEFQMMNPYEDDVTLNLAGFM